MPTAPMHDDSAPFWDKIAPKYAKKPIADPAAYEEKLACLADHLNAHDRVLELGCGTGSTALRLAPSVAEIVATDVSAKMIAIAEEKRVAAGLANVHFRQLEAAAELDDAPFDAILAFSLLHLVPDLPAVLGAVHTQLKPGGLFLSKTVCLGDGSPLVRVFVRALRLVGVAPPVTMLRKADLCDALVAAGFDVVDSRTFGKGAGNPFIVAQRPL